MFLRLKLFFVSAALLLVPMSTYAQDTIEYYGLDAIGSVRVVFDASGNVLARTDYEPFGRIVSSSGNAPDRKFAQLFRDAEAGLDYAEARSYQVLTGRFNGPDPIYAGVFEPQKWNRYAYAINNPEVYIDPDGLDPDFRTGVVGCRTMPWLCGDTLEQLGYFGPKRGYFDEEYGYGRQRGGRIGGGGRGGRGGQTPPPNRDPDPPTPTPPGPNPPGPTPPVPPRPPDPGKTPTPPGGFRLCSQGVSVAGRSGSVDIQSSTPGTVQWGITIRDAQTGVLFTYQRFKEVGAKRPRRDPSKIEFYAGTGGTTHGSQQNLQAGSEFHLNALFVGANKKSAGVSIAGAGCIVH